MKKLPKRKQNRLQGYDYSRNGAYFVTICTKNREELFWKPNIVGAAFCRPQEEPCHPQLSEYGIIVENEIISLSAIYRNIFIDKYVIMPNHTHMIIIIDNYDVLDNGRQNTAPTVSRIINQWKRAISIKIGFSPWQKSFHDRIIRDESEYRKITNYIDNNPVQWEKDCFYEKH